MSLRQIFYQLKLEFDVLTADRIRREALYRRIPTQTTDQVDEHH